MEQQKAVKCPDTGETIIVYVDRGPSSAVVGHGKPLAQPHGIGGGGMQMRLGEPK